MNRMFSRRGVEAQSMRTGNSTALMLSHPNSSAPLRLSGRKFPGFRIADSIRLRLTEIDEHGYNLFNLTAADRRLLADHSHHAMIDYPYGAV